MDKIICVGKNYLEHAEELAKKLGDTVPEKPVLFLKPPSSLVQVALSEGVAQVSLPKGLGEIHPECEIVARVRIQDGTPQIDAVTLGLDMTLRDVQSRLKKNGHPWEISKVFSGSALIGPWISIHEFSEFLDTEFAFTVEGQPRQKGRGREMRLKPLECLRYAAEYFPICTGDLLFTGTPAGVGPIEPGQTGVLSWQNRLCFKIQWN